MVNKPIKIKKIEASDSKMLYFGAIVENTATANQIGNEQSRSDLIRAVAAYKTEMLTITGEILTTNDVFVRATAAELLGEQTATKENIEALKTAFADRSKPINFITTRSLRYFPRSSNWINRSRLNLSDCFDCAGLSGQKTRREFDKAKRFDERFFKCRKNSRNRKPYNAKTGTKLGQILNSERRLPHAPFRAKTEISKPF